uniref:Uncharacterized protein n=2 Tax=Tetranychus urticae TaxID=32264 RepID=T1KB24_TETUR
MSTLISTNSMVISLSISGDTIVAGFLNGSIFTSTIGSRESGGYQIASHSCPPFGLTLTHSGYIVAAGCDGKIAFHLTSGYPSRNVTNKQIIEFGSELTCASAFPSGNSVLLTSTDKMVMFNLESHLWRLNQTIQLAGTHLITAAYITKDGTRMLIGSVTGSVDLFTSQWKKKLIGDKFEVNYVGLSQIVFKNLDNGLTNVFRSDHEIRDVRIIRDSYAVVWTSGSLILATLGTTSKSSEIEWPGLTNSGFKFSFDYENVALIYAAGELFIVELGVNQLLASVRTDHVNPHLMSVRLNERKSGAKVLAYLLDLKTIAIVDLISGLQICTWSHEDKIDWLELNETTKRLLFRDKQLRLHLLDILAQESTVLLNFCGFVQWVPGSDVVVAQARDKVYVWYDFSRPVIHDIPGDSKAEVMSIEREGGLSRVTFTGNIPDIILDDVLLEFDTALEDGDLRRAMSFLETCELSPESEAMWKQLANVALQSSDISVAERAYAAIGDVTRASFFRQCFDNQSKLALLEGDWSNFESNNFDDVIETYVTLHKWDKAIELAARMGRIDVKDSLETRYLDYLSETDQQAEAGRLMEKKGHYEEAIKLYLRSGWPFQAAALLFDMAVKKPLNIKRNLLEELVAELKDAQFYEEAGRLCEMAPLSDPNAAYELYLTGNCFGRAIDLARREFPEEVVNLEAKYGDWLMNSARDPAGAINHYIEAGQNDKALKAAVEAGQFEKAAEIVPSLDVIPSELGRSIAEHYASSGQIDAAQEIYLTCGLIEEAVSLLNKAGQFSRAYRLAKNYMSGEAAREMYENIARSMEGEGKYREAERIYITCDDVDSAISMYKAARQYDSMIRLVKQYHPDLLNDTHLHLAKELENEGLHAQAEGHYVAAGEWKNAVRMYKNANKWEDAYRVARSYGGAVPAKQVAFLWAKSLSDSESAVKLLTRFGLLNQVIDYAVECNAFEFAISLVTNAGPEMKHKLTDVRLKYALWLEDEGRYDEAEALFLAANKPREAVLMYLHAKSFSDALRVAEQYVKDENVVSGVLVAESKSLLERPGGTSIETMMKAESLLLRAGRIELAVKMYKDMEMWDEALRVCEQYSPVLIDSVKRDMILSGNRSSASMADFRSVESGSTNGSRLRGSVASRGSPATSRSGSISVPITPSESYKRDLKSDLEAAEAANDKENIVRYCLLLVSQLVGKKSFDEAVRLINKYPVVLATPESRTLLIRIANDLMAFELPDEPDSSTWKNLRNALSSHLSTSNGTADDASIDKYLLITHYLVLRRALTNLADFNGVSDLLCKLTVSLVRYTDVLRVDKFFYEAGLAAKENGRLDMAFIFWNHFLDLIDAIEEGDVNVDHSDFEATDIPSEVPLPSTPYSIEGQPNLIEDVKSWILQVSMDSKISHNLPVDPYWGNVYEASLVNTDGTRCLPCLVTGYPVHKHKILELKPNKYAANKDDWNKLLMITKVSGSDELKEILLFIGKLCGNATVARFTFQ